MAGKGGARPGSGRKRGGKNQKTREIADRATAEGITPLEVMVGAMRELWAEAEKVKGPERLSLMRQASEEANRAAPYMHPRLASIEHSGKDGGPIETKDVGSRELARRLLFAVAAAETAPKENRG